MFLRHKFVFFVLVSAVAYTAHAQELAIEGKSKSTVRIEINGASLDSSTSNEHLIKQFFVKHRKEHLNIVNNMRKMKDYEKRYKMVEILAENSFTIIEASRNIIHDIKFVPGGADALKNLTIRNALSTILDNCALFGDVTLQLPDITRRILKRDEHWNATFQWGLEFVNGTHHFLDEPTIEMFDLVRQELRIVPRNPNYVNPYWPSTGAGNRDKTTMTNEKNSRRKKMKDVNKGLKRTKGPRIVDIEL